MANNKYLTVIKIIHTLIWIFFNIVIGYLFYAVIAGKIDKWVWIGLGLIAIECLVLVIFKNICPVTVLARRYSSSKKDNFDIYLPNWLAKNNKLIYTVIVAFVLILLAYRLKTQAL